jgi:signal peptidase II
MTGLISSIYTKKMALFSLAAIFLIILDRVFKVWSKLVWSAKPQELTSWFHLTYSPNSSLAFSLPANQYFILAVVIALFLIITAVGLNKLRRQDYQAIWWLLIVLGAASNLLDRLLYGAVIDYLSVPWLTTFNLADGLITVGVAALVLQELLPKNQK